MARVVRAEPADRAGGPLPRRLEVGHLQAEPPLVVPLDGVAPGSRPEDGSEQCAMEVLGAEELAWDAWVHRFIACQPAPTRPGAWDFTGSQPRFVEHPPGLLAGPGPLAVRTAGLLAPARWMRR